MTIYFDDIDNKSCCAVHQEKEFALPSQLAHSIHVPNHQLSISSPTHPLPLESFYYGCSRLVSVHHLLHPTSRYPPPYTMLTLMLSSRSDSPASLLPTPRFSSNASSHSDDEDDGELPMPSTALTTLIRPYGGRKGWRPSKPEEFGDGGAYPECSLAQYPLGMGKKKVKRLSPFYSSPLPSFALTLHLTRDRL